MQEPVGGGVQHQPELVGGGFGAGGPVRGEVQLVGLDQILGLASGTVDLLVEPAWRAGQVGDDEPAVRTPLGGFDPPDLSLRSVGNGLRLRREFRML